MKSPSTFFRDIKSSIFVRLFCIVLLTGVGINLLVFVAVPVLFMPHMPQSMENLMHRAFQSTADDIAKDSSFRKASELAAELGQGIRIEGDGWQWTSDNSLPSIDEFAKHMPSTKRNFLSPPQLPPFVHVYKVKFDRGPARIAFFGIHGPDFIVNLGALVALLTLLTMVILSSYILIRRMLRPLKILTEGVEIISSGNFDHQVNYGSKDEFGRLVIAFNQMTLKIKGMIEGKKRLLLDVSHELRTPLSRARVALEFIPDPNTRKEVLEEVEEMSRLVHGILEGAQADKDLNSLKLESVLLSDIILSTTDKYRHAANPISFKSLALDYRVFAEPDQVRIVLRNLIENAIKYSAPQAEIEIECFHEKDQVMVRVSDHGPGIPSDELERIFEPFYRVDKSRTRETGGFGLGLSLCKKIIEAHGGRMWAQSEEGHGSKFYFSLKASSSKNVTAA